MKAYIYMYPENQLMNAYLMTHSDVNISFKDTDLTPASEPPEQRMEKS